MSRIVLIEDDANSARLASRLLARAGHAVEVAVDGGDGLTLIAAHPPELVLVDLGLPDVDGQTVIAMLRQTSAMQQVPIVVFTAWPQETAQAMMTAYGCDGLIVKPIDTRTFVDQVNRYLLVRDDGHVEKL
ncbi:MAG: response regulator [Chloroflexota bacterium]|nr:response regulator [Chloroflexota bacterium]